MRSLFLATLLVIVPLIHAQSPAIEGDIEDVSGSRTATLDAAFSSLLKKHQINTAGVAVIKEGRVKWQNQYGLQSEGVPASADTLFKVASLTKTVAAETILRLVAAGKLSLDESMSPYWVDPDLKDDPNHHRLTARMMLSHRSGLPNWRFFTDDRKLKFVHEPGTQFGYSGEGFQYLMRYAENKLGMPFETLARVHLFEPLGINNASLTVRKKNFDRIAKPLDASGKFFGYYCNPWGYCREEGDCSVAGDMVITVADYATFLIASMDDQRLSNELRQERNALQTISYPIDCSQYPELICTTRLGYGLGWNITQWETGKLIGHSGSDWSTVSLAYYYEGSRDGLIVFFNAPNKAGIAGMVDALELLDPDSPKLHEYRTRAARSNN